jgi:hypothetical protein
MRLGRRHHSLFEPCAVLLEFARKAMRLEQESAIPLACAPGELETIELRLIICSKGLPEESGRRISARRRTRVA